MKFFNFQRRNCNNLKHENKGSMDLLKPSLNINNECQKRKHKDDHPYRCINCGYPVKELFHVYSPTVQKLTKCLKCKSFVDSFIEFDNLFIIINLILLSSQAQRHILYNSECKNLYKLLMIITIVESYFLWNELSQTKRNLTFADNNSIIKDPLFMEKGFYLSSLQIILCKYLSI